MRNTIYVLIAIILVFSFNLQSQNINKTILCNEQKGIDYGVVSGIYLGGSGSAKFYSGQPDVINNVNYVLNNQYWHNDIRKLLNVKDTFFISNNGYPTKMKYQPALNFGLFVRYSFNCNFNIYANFSYVRLRLRDKVIFEVDPPIDFLAEPDYRYINIIGLEERNIIDVGITKYFGINEGFRIFLTTGFTFNNVKVKESKLIVEGKDFNLINIYGSGSYVPGASQSFNHNQGGLGFGVFAGMGLRFDFNNLIAIEPGFNLYLNKVNLEGFNNFYPQYLLFLKLCLKDFIDF